MTPSGWVSGACTCRRGRRGATGWRSWTTAECRTQRLPHGRLRLSLRARRGPPTSWAPGLRLRNGPSVPTSRSGERAGGCPPCLMPSGSSRLAPNHLALHDDHPACGFLAATFSSRPLPPSGAGASPLLTTGSVLSPTARILHRLARRFIREDAAVVIPTYHLAYLLLTGSGAGLV